MKRDPNRLRRWDAVIRRIPTDREWIGAEVGVWVGATARRVLAQRPKVTWLMIDAWTAPHPKSTYALSPDTIAKNEQPYFENCFHKTLTAVRSFGARAVIHRLWSQEAVAEIEDGSLDCAFVDAEHTYEGVTRDIALWLPKVKPGGWIGGHDYRAPRFPGVQRAVDEAFGTIESDIDRTWFYYIGGKI